MSDSDEEREQFCFYGKPLDPYDEDTIPRKRPISVEEQIATDAQGRRRFHGAFTGGFSAGFFNTVGSLEGWLPGEFKSSRSDKFKSFNQKPEDFMDDDDLGEDGIAPQVIKATNEYNTSRKRKKQVFNDGPIPGEPVLHNILTSGNETIGYMLLKSLRIKNKKKQQAESSGRTYGCEMPKPEELFELDDCNQYEVPDIYKEYLARPKDNTFGLGYSGLDKNQLSLFPTQSKTQIHMTDKNNKKFSISGQAFGVGAFEEEDDDIYMKEDMSRYDFELAEEKVATKEKKVTNKLVLGIFERSKLTPVLKAEMNYPPPAIPHSFTGIHKVRKSRFEPLPEETPSTSRSKINPMVRARYLGEESEKEYTLSKPVQEKTKKEEVTRPDETATTSSTLDAISFLSDRFVSSSQKEDVTNILEKVEKTQTEHGTSQMRDAVRMKMFGPLTRISSDWTPSSLLCKRFNVPEPCTDRPEKSRTRTKNIIFEYQKHIEEEQPITPGLKQETVSSTVPSSEVVVKEEPATESTETEQLEENKSKETKPKDITDRLDLDQQQDLFKAIFMSSDSESEKEDEDNDAATIKATDEQSEEKRKEELKDSVLSDQLLPQIRPLKQGILSGINFIKPTKPVENSSAATEVEIKVETESESSDCYGPRIPETLPVTEKVVATKLVISSDSGDEWIEKGESDGKKKKKHKKEKKHKSKHKKEKRDKKRK